MADLERIEPAALVEKHLPEVHEVWAEATDERVGRTLPQHTEREGFRFVAVRDADGRMAGFAYGYRGAPGQWWHDVVAEGLGPEGTARWLTPGHFLFAELYVRADLRRRGIGSRLHDGLLAGLDSRTAVLSTEQDNEPAVALYVGRGWQVILDRFRFGSQGLYRVLGRELG